MGFNEGLPLADEGAKFIGSEVHSVEVGQAVLALNFINAQLDLAEGLFFLLVQVGKGEFNDTAL